MSVGNVQFVNVPDEGVPNAGVVSVGEVANTAEPEPVLSVNAVAKSEELKEPNDVVVLADVIAPVKFGILVVVVAVPVSAPTNVVAVITPVTLIPVVELFPTFKTDCNAATPARPVRLEPSP